MLSTPFTWPTMLPNWRRGVPSMPRPQRGLVIMFSMLGIVSLGGADRPFFRSLWRCPMICRSSVRTSAEQLAALARSIRRSMKSRSRITYSWNQNGWLLGRLRHVLDRADAHGRQRERDAELLGRARRQDLAVGVLHAGQAHRRDRDRHRHRLADHRRAGGAVLQVHRDPLAQQDPARNRPRSRDRCSRSTSRCRRSRRTCAARGAWPGRAGPRYW